MEKLVGRQWTWFSDYAYFEAQWSVGAPPSRDLEVGIGIKAFGHPRGGRFRFRQALTFSTRGLGAIHVRLVDGGPPCVVELQQGDASTLTLYPPPWRWK